MIKLLLASNNHGKQLEVKAILKDLPYELVTPEMLGINLDVPENGSTYTENALIKAKAFFSVSGLPSLADDSGLEVEALNGAPGMQSHRWAGENKSDYDRILFLLEKLRTRPHPWKAAFHSVVAFYDGEISRVEEGICTGRIIPEPRGAMGFGYDPVFLLDGESLTMAEAGPQLKNRLGHRARALQKLAPFLRDYAQEKDQKIQPCL